MFNDIADDKRVKRGVRVTLRFVFAMIMLVVIRSGDEQLAGGRVKR